MAIADESSDFGLVTKVLGQFFRGLAYNAEFWLSPLRSCTLTMYLFEATTCDNIYILHKHTNFHGNIFPHEKNRCQFVGTEFPQTNLSCNINSEYCLNKPYLRVSTSALLAALPLDYYC